MTIEQHPMMPDILKFRQPVEDGEPCPQCGHHDKAVRLLANDSPPPWLRGYAVTCEGCGWHSEPRNLAHNAIRAWNAASRKAAAWKTETHA